MTKGLRLVTFFASVFISIAFNYEAMADGHQSNHQDKTKVSKKKHGRKAAHAHEHGHAKVNVAVEGKEAKIVLDVPADGIYGFEHAAKSAADTKKMATGLATAEAKGSDMFIFDSSLGCIVKEAKSQKEEGEGSDHADVNVTYHFVCKKPLADAVLKFGVTKVFPRIKTLQVQAISATSQSAATITGDLGEITL